ncbi:MAG: hypothetical protein H6613_08235 [Ignavibacteriales bacterium]|nr:hypothetical protein [Ignavibacteriales bacterium]
MGKNVFENDNIQLEANSRHIISPDWNDLRIPVKKIYVDLGDDGSIDDSIFVVNNSPTGINDNPINEIPKGLN